MKEKELEVSMARMQEKINNISSKLDDHLCDQDKQFNRLYDKIDDILLACDKRYATKEVVDSNRKSIEKLESWKGNIPMIATAVIVALIAILTFFRGG